ncbi:hypothetical protein GIB67_006481 [Kingdonia uniflora]|uniref:Uncharacterized protein n=1 Tax=Kingdonia uniflora TaxID=39325 RepID=A0A7J7LEF8_9MAGN|nr:hypothetical protein GIB67_006481 [Kingdonia uniflora]
MLLRPVFRRVWNGNILLVSGECLQRSDEEPLELNNRTITKGISCKVLRKESFIDAIAREGTEVEAILKELGISRFKRVASKDDKLAWLNKMPDGPLDMATVSSTVVRNLAKKKAVKRGAASRSVTSDSVEESDKIADGADLRPRFEFARALRGVQLGLQDRLIELEKRISQLEGEKNQFEENLTRKREAFQLELEKEREAAALKLKKVRAKSVAEAERLVTASDTSQNNLAGKLYQLSYTKAEILAFNEGNYEEKGIMGEEEVEEMEDGLNVAKKTTTDNQETIDQLDIAREREEQILLHNAEYAEEYEALISQYEDRLDDNVKLSLKLEEAKSQVEDMTATSLSRDLALNQLTSELAELKEKAASGSRYEAELAEYRIRALNDEISDMKCNIRALNEQLLKKEIDLDTARTNLAVSEADLKKLNSSIAGKDLELRNSTQIRDSFIARLDRLKADLRRLKRKEAQSRADLAEELRVRELKYENDLKFELNKRDGEIAYGEGSREMKEFLRRKEEFVENMRIDLINSW